MPDKMLGRLPRTFRPTIPFSALLGSGAKLPARPDHVNNGDKVKNWGMMLNDSLGCCTCAAKYHFLQAVSTVSRHWQADEPDPMVEKLYQEVGGYDPQNPGQTDNGANMQDVNKHIQEVGMPITPINGRDRHQLLGSTEVDHRNLDHVRRAIYVFGGCDIGFEVPAFVLSGSSHTWDVQSQGTQIEGGHDVILIGYDTKGFRLVSWGETYYMTDAFFQTYVGESYGLADPTWLDATGHTPANMPKQQLLDILRQKW